MKTPHDGDSIAHAGDTYYKPHNTMTQPIPPPPADEPMAIVSWIPAK